MTTLLSADAFERLALDHPDRQWELHGGRLVEKPPMAWEHNITTRNLAHDLADQLDRREYEVVYNLGRVNRAGESYFIPDVYIIPRSLRRRLFRPGRLEAYPEPLPLVVEIWSPSTGDYDIDTKIPEYRRRGDLEIWRIHPYERTLTAWRRQSDGTYTETVYTEGIVQLTSLPGVFIDLDALFVWE